MENQSAEPVTPANDEVPAAAPAQTEHTPETEPRARVIQFSRFARFGRNGAPAFDIPRLNISDELERNAFVAVLLIGAVFIGAGEYLNLISVQMALFVAITCIAGYGLLCFTGREQRVRLDRAGDNCYYLGLTYTLMSMSAALYKLQPGVAPDFLIQAFGIALGSTICGVIARLLLIQYRMEPDDIETRARVQLAAAAEALTQQLIDAAARFQSFAVSIQDSVKTAVMKLTDEQIDRQKDLVTEINAVLVTAIEAIGQSTSVIESSLKKHSTVMEKYQGAAERSATAADLFAMKIEQLSVPEDLISKGFGTIQASLEQAITQLNSAAGQFGNVAGDISTASTRFVALSEQSGVIGNAMTNSTKSIGELKIAIEGMTAAVSAEAARLATGNQALDGEVEKLKNLSLEYAHGLTEVAQFLAKELGPRVRT